MVIKDSFWYVILLDDKWLLCYIVVNVLVDQILYLLLVYLLVIKDKKKEFKDVLKELKKEQLFKFFMKLGEVCMLLK